MNECKRVEILLDKGNVVVAVTATADTRDQAYNVI